jgi:peptide/nickel transport system substrate-binding protein
MCALAKSEGNRIRRRVLTRRDFITKSAVSASVVTLLVACGGGSSTESATTQTGGQSASSPSSASSSTGTASGGGTPKPGGKITLADQYLPPTLDIHATTNDFLDIIGQQVYQPLVYLNPDTKEPVPGLAKSWDVSQDGRIHTFKLRTDIKFHDGTTLKSDAVKASWDRLLDPAEKSPRASLLGGDNLDTYEASDAETVVVTHKGPMANFLPNIARTFAMIISPAAIQKYGAKLSEQMVGTGPFTLKDYAQADHVTLARWDDFNSPPSFFKHQGAAYLDEVTWKSIEDEGTRISAVQSGELQIGRLPWSQVALFNNGVPGFSVTTISNPGVPAGMYLNSQLAPLDDQKVRTAIAQAIDRNAIIQSPNYAGAVWEEMGPLTKDVWGYDPASKDAWPKFDVKAAKDLLTQAGYSPGADGIMAKDGNKIVLSLPIFSLTVPFAQIIQSQLKQIGIDLQLRQMDQAAVSAEWYKWTQHLLAGANTGNDPDVLWDVFHSGGTAHAQDADVDQLLEQGRTTIDPAARKEVYSKIQQLLAQKVYSVEVYNSARNYAVQSKVQGIRFNDRAGIYCYDIWLKQ